MASNTTVCAKNINCENITIKNKNSTNRQIVITKKVTFDNTSSSDTFLKNAAFFQIMWPANTISEIGDVFVTNSSMVMATNDDFTIVNIADGTNPIVGDASNITIGQAPGSGSAGQVIFEHNSEREVSGAEVAVAQNQLQTYATFSTEDRIFTGVVYHDINGKNDGDGDFGSDGSGLKDSHLFITLKGIKLVD